MRKKLHNIVLIGLMVAILSILSQIIIPIGSIPFSMAVFAVFLIGGLLTPIQAGTTIAVYLCIGIIGLPVFAGFKGGPQVLFGVTGGFLIGYFALVLSVSWAKKLTQNKVLHFVLATLGLFVCYTIGTVWFMYITGSTLYKALLLCVFPFIIPDIVKIIMAQGASKIIMKRLKESKVIA